MLCVCACVCAGMCVCVCVCVCVCDECSVCVCAQSVKIRAFFFFPHTKSHKVTNREYFFFLKIRAFFPDTKSRIDVFSKSDNCGEVSTVKKRPICMAKETYLYGKKGLSR